MGREGFDDRFAPEDGEIPHNGALNGLRGLAQYDDAPEDGEIAEDLPPPPPPPPRRRDKSSERHSDKNGARDVEKERGRSRDSRRSTSPGDRAEKERKEHRDNDRDRERKEKSLDLGRKRDGDRYREKDSTKERERDRERDRDREKTRDGDKVRDREKDRHKDRDRERDRGKERDREKDREREKAREKRSEASKEPRERERDRERRRETSEKPRDRDDREKEKERRREASEKPRDREDRERRREDSEKPRERERERRKDEDGDRRKDRRSRSPSRDRREKRGRDSEAEDQDRKKVKMEIEEMKDVKLEEVGKGAAVKEEDMIDEKDDKKDVKKVEPLSLEDLLKKRQQEAAELAKPKFLTKKQREELAMKRREEEAALQRQKVEEQRKALFGPPAAVAGGKDAQSDRDRDRDRDRERDREREKERERERDRERDRERERDRDRRDRDRDRDRGRGDDRMTAEERDRERKERNAQKEKEKELEAIKEQYLGLAKKKKRVIRPSDKFKFAFDWEAGEDTSRDLNPIYNNPHEAQLLFGRGLKAGIDVRVQKKAAAQQEKELFAQRRKETGEVQTEEERASDARKARAADEYNSSFDMRVDAHWTQKKLSQMTERDWRIFREDFNISFKGSNIPKPMRNWDESGLTKEVLQAVEKAGYTKPSPIQMAAIPLGLQQRDVIGIAETGSGKTAAFVLPMLVYISKLPPLTEENEALGPYALIMAPTRELAQQIEEETVKFASFMDFRVTSIVGGQSIEEQGFKLRQGCEIVIATPGRMLDCLERRYAVLQQCHYIVLDEADRMIDMGFEPQVAAVLDLMPSSNLKPENEDEELEGDKLYRTTYMFSATMPPAVERLARKYLRQPVVVTIGHAGKTTDLITQTVMMVKGENEKKDKLKRLLEDLGERQAIIFVNQKKSADGLARQLERDGFKVTSLHGGKIQDQREVSLEGFRQKKFTILVATDVAGRGIDIPDVAAVVNYDMPTTIDQYTHRIGRTGRAGKKGVATSFLTNQDTDLFYDLKQMLVNSNSTVPPELARHEAAKFKPGTIRDRAPG